MFLEHASQEQEEKICRQIGMTKEQLHQGLLAIREWLKWQPHLPSCIDDSTIKSFIIGCKNSLERAKEKLDTFYSAKGELPQYFSNRDPTDEAFRETMRSKPVVLLPQLTDDCCRVTICLTAEPDPSKHSVDKYIQIMLAIMEIRFRTDIFCAGDYFIFDCRNFVPSHAVKISPTHVRNMVALAEDVLPIKVKGIIFINAPPTVEFIANKLLIPFLKEKIAKRVHVYKEDYQVLYKHVSKNILPKDYDGEQDSMENLSRSLMRKLEEERDWLLKEGSMATIEEKRPKSSDFKKNKFNFGLDGSFRQLSID